jgi:hypothetical protein
LPKIILDCYSTGTINGNNDVGGIVGFANYNTTINNCYATGAVSGNDDVGGVAGFITTECTLTDSYATGTISGNDNVGGVLGISNHLIAMDAQNITITNCYATGAVSGNTDVGGVAGSIRSAMFAHCYATGAVSGSGPVGGIVGYIASSDLKNCVALNPSVKGTDITVGRVAGGGSTLADLAAWDGILNNAGNTTWSNKGAADIDGADMTASAIQADGTLGNRFTGAGGWTTADGKLPGLSGTTVDIPAHLSATSPNPNTLDLANPPNTGFFSITGNVITYSGPGPLQIQGSNGMPYSIVVTQATQINLAAGTVINGTTGTAALTVPAGTTINGQGAGISITGTKEAISSAGNVTISGTIAAITGGDDGIAAMGNITINGTVTGAISGGVGNGIGSYSGGSISISGNVGSISGDNGSIFTNGTVNISGTTGAISSGNKNAIYSGSDITISGTIGNITGNLCGIVGDGSVTIANGATVGSIIGTTDNGIWVDNNVTIAGTVNGNISGGSGKAGIKADGFVMISSTGSVTGNISGSDDGIVADGNITIAGTVTGAISGGIGNGICSYISGNIFISGNIGSISGDNGGIFTNGSVTISGKVGSITCGAGKSQISAASYAVLDYNAAALINPANCFPATFHTVTFDYAGLTPGGDELQFAYLAGTDKIPAPTAPNYVPMIWTDAMTIPQWNFATDAVTADMTLYAGGTLTSVTFTATQTGGTSGTANSTGIVLDFSPNAVTALTAAHITIAGGTGAATKGTLSEASGTGTNTVWTIALTAVATEGDVTVSIADFGTFTVTNTQTVAVFKNTSTPPPPPPPPAVRPTITGPASMTLQPGYAATRTETYATTGTSPVTVTKQSGNAAITWNNSTKRLDIAAGLPAGKYEVVLRAQNTAGSATLTFTLTVEEPVYWMEILTFTGGKVTTNPPYISEAGKTVTLTITPDEGYELESITVTDMNNAGIVIPLSGTGLTRTFVMPSHHVAIVAIFKSTGANNGEEIQSGLKAYAQNSTLNVSGLSEGSTLYVYNILGTLVYQGVANSDKAEIALPGRGVYVIVSGNNVIKTAN